LLHSAIFPGGPECPADKQKEGVMKVKTVLINMLTVWLATINSAFAATSTKVYNSGILVLVFIGFIALVVVVQMIPAILTLLGMIKGLVRENKTRTAEVRALK
jgi:hypothetical protein